MSTSSAMATAPANGGRDGIETFLRFAPTHGSASLSRVFPHPALDGKPSGSGVRVCPAAEVREAPVELDHYCVEAIRRVCLCASLGCGAIMLAPPLQFEFRPLAAPVTQAVAVFA